MSPTRTELVKWLSLIAVKGKTLDFGGGIWSMRNKVASFQGTYKYTDEDEIDLSKRTRAILQFAPSEKYDNIFCTEVMQFVIDPLTALRNMSKMLEDDGNLYLSFHLTHPPMKGHDYFRYTPKGIGVLLGMSDLTVKEFLEPVEGYYLVHAVK